MVESESMVEVSRLTKKWQGRVVEACVGSSLLYDCQARVWYKRDEKKLQKWMDKCHRYAWSNRNGEPLRQMQKALCRSSEDVSITLSVRLCPHPSPRTSSSAQYETLGHSKEWGFTRSGHPEQKKTIFGARGLPGLSSVSF